jgi:hypothetical protein
MSQKSPALSRIAQLLAQRRVKPPRPERAALFRLAMSQNRYHEVVVREIHYAAGLETELATGTNAGKMLHLDVRHLEMGDMSREEMELIRVGDKLMIITDSRHGRVTWQIKRKTS